MTTARRSRSLAVALVSLTTAGALAADGPPVKPGQKLERLGDEIVVCGQLFHTTTPVVLWTDPGGYDAYRVERRFVPLDQASWAATKEALAKEAAAREPAAKDVAPENAVRKGLSQPNRFSTRKRPMSPEQAERVRGGGWSLGELQDVVDQFVIHFDACGTSKKCFQVLHDQRGLSVQFMLDVDGTIYQTLDLKEGAWHATVANGRSVGIEIANVGAYRIGGGAAKAEADPFARWYAKGPDGKTALTVPGGLENTGVRDKSAPLRPSRDEPITGWVQGAELRQYDYTPQQYEALTKLTATLCTIFPKLKCDYPRDGAGALLLKKLPDDRLKAYEGILGHYHVQTNKVDPGPAFQWDKLIDGARRLTGR